MPDWLRESASASGELSWSLIGVRLLVALLLGCVVAAIYWYSRRTPVTDSAPSLVPTLVLLTVIIAMVTLAIGDSAARAFALVGSLAIVRFRTVVDDTRDTAFVILAVAVGLSAGAGFLRVPLLGIPIAAIAAFLFQGRRLTLHQTSHRLSIRSDNSSRPADSQTYQLVLRLSLGQADSQRWQSLLQPFVTDCSVVQVATARQGSVLDLTYRVVLLPTADPALCVATCNRQEGVQSVELRRVAADEE
ncbi:MAG: DUF4956 domain-containing protein [Planctomycetota bacterium]